MKPEDGVTISSVQSSWVVPFYGQMLDDRAAAEVERQIVACGNQVATLRINIMEDRRTAQATLDATYAALSAQLDRAWRQHDDILLQAERQRSLFFGLGVAAGAVVVGGAAYMLSGM